ncbi:MAG: nucleotidyltransferase [Lentisphaerae bacterium RIFOXYC12_FULL_60_16]|nr:MAG: nucleotidyltransferase [Lentisphaerae bacterium RIFOXYC12_FULL_60_16]OGV85557.1 MAG: nucleotidyltransferase [Lentisphaerae bacterium RIFOXYB12_FULL_60_10]
MKRQEVLHTLVQHRHELAEMKVRSLAIFGSVARDEAVASSDVDVLVEFDEQAQVGLFHLIGVKQYLENLLHCTVDLGTPDTLREPIRTQALKESIRVA